MSHQNLIIVGAGWAGQTIASVLLQKKESEEKTPSILGFVDDCPPSNRILVANGNGGLPIPVLGHSGKLLDIALQTNATGVILAITHNRADHLFRQVIKCHENGIPVYEMTEIYSQLTRKIPVQHINRHWIVPHLTAPKHDLYALFYDAVNYLFGFFGFLFVVTPLYPLIALAIKVDSEGPVLFKQKRVGKKGRIFTLLKFRTMAKDAEKNGSAWTTKNDTRITQVGRWLRKFRLDELPQFINIIKGEMALIGPRPEAVELVEQFREEIPFYEYRNLVLPGITGWAQVNHENTCSVEGALEKLQYDLYWIKNSSFLLDLKIIFKSIRVMLTGFGAV